MQQDLRQSRRVTRVAACSAATNLVQLAHQLMILCVAELACIAHSMRQRGIKVGNWHIHCSETLVLLLCANDFYDLQSNPELLQLNTRTSLVPETARCRPTLSPACANAASSHTQRGLYALRYGTDRSLAHWLTGSHFKPAHLTMDCTGPLDSLATVSSRRMPSPARSATESYCLARSSL